jgi:DNA-binding beta-propeller fold protein YncE
VEFAEKINPMKKLFVLMFGLAVISLAAGAQSAPGYKVTKTWKLGGIGGWDYLTVDTDGNRLFIARSTRVMVVDKTSGKLITEIPDTPGVHGIALAPEFGRGFISAGGEDMVTVFDLKSLKVLNKVKVGSKPDAIVYDPFTKRVFTFNAAGKDTTAIDAAKGEVVGKIDLGGKPEFSASDGKGTMFVNIEDTSEIVAFDPQTLAVKSRWKLAGCEEPTGLALDKKNRRLFAGCGGNKKMAIVNADSGKLVAMPDIGEGCDATAFDAEQNLAFASAGDGTITVIREESADKFSVVETVKTQPSARTMAADTKTGELYTVAAKVLPGRKVEPDTFVVLVAEKSH